MNIPRRNGPRCSRGWPTIIEAVAEHDELISTLATEETWTPGMPLRAAPDVASLTRLDLQWRTETAEAATLMRDLSDVDPAEWPLDGFPRTPAMVFQMLKRFRSESARSPLSALLIADAAERIGEEFSKQEHSGDVILQVRGRIAKERSLALRYLGRFEEALASLDRAERLFAQLAMPDFDLATVGYNRAMVFGEIDKYDEGLDLIATAESTFGRFGVARRVAHSKIVRAGLLYYKGRIDDARDLFSLVLSSSDLDRESVPIAMLDLACCDLELGDFHQGKALSESAIKLFETVANPLGALRARWAIGRALLGIGQEENGVSLLHEVATEYRERGMFSEAALVLLYIVEHSLAHGDDEEAARLCTSALERFVIAGMPAAAAKAMAHLRDLAARGEARITDVGEVRAAIGDSSGQFRHISM